MLKCVIVNINTIVECLRPFSNSTHTLTLLYTRLIGALRGRKMSLQFKKRLIITQALDWTLRNDYQYKQFHCPNKNKMNNIGGQYPNLFI